MKKITLLIILLITSITFSQNLITKGDFEDLTPGDITTTAGTDYWFTTNISGNPRAAVATDGSNKYGVLKNLTGLSRLIYRFDVVSGTTYELTFKVADEADNDKELTVTLRNGSNDQQQAFVPGTQSNVLDVIRDAGTAVNGAFAIAFDTMDATLTEHSVKFTADATQTVDIWFQKNKTTSTGGEVYLDDVVFEASTLGIDDLKAYSFNYSPNPVNDIINLSASKTIDNITLYNTLGQKAFETKVNALRSNLSISELPTGIYIMQVTIEDAIGSYKIIKR